MSVNFKKHEPPKPNDYGKELFKTFGIKRVDQGAWEPIVCTHYSNNKSVVKSLMASSSKTLAMEKCKLEMFKSWF